MLDQIGLTRTLRAGCALVEEGEYILPAKFDQTDLPGLLPTVAYLDLSEIAPATLVEFVLEKVGNKIGR